MTAPDLQPEPARPEAVQPEAVHPGIDAVVFDLGNVLVRWEPERAWRHLDAGVLATFHEEVDFMAWNSTMDGGVTTAEAVEAMAGSTPRHEHVAASYVENFLDTLPGPVPGTRAVVEELAAAGVRLVALTNWSAELFARARPRLEEVVGLSTFEGVVVSGVERLAKPDPAVFRLVLERYGLTAARTAFVDDSPRNVDAAAGTGIHAVHFTDSRALRTALADLGLPVSPRS